MKATRLLLLTALALPSAAFANEGAHIDGYYIPYSAYETSADGGDSAELEGDGFGVKAMIPIGPYQNFFAIGEYQSTSQDKKFDNFKVDTDFDQFRIGAGFQIPLATGTGALYAEYISVEQKFESDQPFTDLGGFEFEPDGFGVHGRLAFPIADGVNVYGQIGYVSLSADNDIDAYGAEFLVGASLDVTRNVGAFIDYRQTNFQIDYNDDGGNDDDYLRDLRIGVRILFDTGGRRDYR